MFKQFSRRRLRNYASRFVLGNRKIQVRGNWSSLKFKQSFTYRYVVKPGVVLTGTCGIIYLIDKYAYASVVTRSLRSIYVMSWIAYQYSQNASAFEDINDLHELAANKLFNMLVENKGMYIKLGQAIANNGNLFPYAFRKKFTELYDRAPVDPWDSINRVLRQSLGPNYESLIFEYIDHEPVASASIAQVHTARLKNTGEAVAIKVQHPYLSKQIPIDLLIYKIVSKLYEKVFDLPMSKYTDYISSQLIQEADFVNEMENAEHSRYIIESDSNLHGSNIVIPENYPNLTSRRVIVNEWIDGVPLSDKKRLIEEGFNIGVMMSQYIRVFAKQTFLYGFIHADPHPGNLIARFKNGKQQLVILDHGLYVTLRPSFRLDYGQLWMAIFTSDMNRVKEIGRSWGIQASEIFAPLVLLQSPKTGTFDSNMTLSGADFLRLFLSDDEKFPFEIFFLTRTMIIIQNMNRVFESPVNRINILTLESIRGASDTTMSVSKHYQILKIRVKLFASDLLFFLWKLLSFNLFSFLVPANIEEYIEIRMKTTSKSLGFELS